jgi:hypothetical protein
MKMSTENYASTTENGEEKKKIEHHFHLPALERQLVKQVTHYEQEEKRLQQITKLYDAAIMQWEEYCKHIIGRESSELKLLLASFPSISMMDENDVTRIINEHSKIIAQCIAGPLRDEFDILSTRFLHSLSNSGIDEREAASTLSKCYGMDICAAIVYYKQFTNFISIATASKTTPTSSSNIATKDDDKNDSTILATLHLFVVHSSNNNNNEHDDLSSHDSTLLLQFKTSPLTRTNLIFDLQQLETFLSSRKQELSLQQHRSSSVSHRIGRDIVNVIEMEWTQYCMKQQFPLILLEDVIRYHDSVRTVLSQFIGNARLLFLADNVGVPIANNDDDIWFTPSFHKNCKNAAQLAYRLALYERAMKTCTQVVETCALAAQSTRKQIAIMKQHLQ